MPDILNRCAPTVLILFAAFFVFGCSPNSESPREKVNATITRASQQVAEHDRLFEKSRDTYAEVKENLESGEDPSKQKENITETRNTLEEARSNLQDARDAIRRVPKLDVKPVVKDYVRQLSEAMDAQLAAEATEIEFYGILQEDPALENNREKALDLLSQVDEDYQRAEKAYVQAREIATSNPGAIDLPQETTDGPEETTQETTGFGAVT